MIALEDSRREVPQPDKSSSFKKLALVYTICPRCGRDFRVTGEKKAAVLVLALIFVLLTASFVIESWVSLAFVAAIVLLQNKIRQTIIRAEHA